MTFLINPYIYGAGLPLSGLSIDDYVGTFFYLPHRGCEYLYPEHTTPAYGNTLTNGAEPWIDMDVQLLSDGVTPVIMYDSTVDRVTTSSGNVSSKSSAQWSSLAVDADTWHGSNFGNALSALFLDNTLTTYKGSAIFTAEAMVSGSGAKIVSAYQAAGIPTDQGMVQSFMLSELSAAVSAGYPAMGKDYTGANSASAMVSAGCTWACINKIRGATAISTYVSAGLYTVIYLVNRRSELPTYSGLGLTAIYSSDPLYLSATTPFSTTDDFSSGTWSPGMLACTDGYDNVDRGRFYSTDYWGYSDTSYDIYRGCLMGWACPIKSDSNADDYTIDLTVKFGTVPSGDQTRWASVFISNTDAAFIDSSYTGAPSGYHFLLRKNGTIQIYKSVAGSASLLVQNTSGSAISDGSDIRFKIVVSPSQLQILRLDGGGSTVQSVTSTDTTYRGGYFHLGHAKMPAYFRAISIT